MLRKIISIVFLLPLGIVLVALSVANRERVSVVLDPFNPQDPVLAYTMPLFVLLLGAIVLGIIIGGLVVWFGQGKARNAARTNKSQARKWESEAVSQRERAEKLIATASGADTTRALPAPSRSS